MIPLQTVIATGTASENNLVRTALEHTILQGRAGGKPWKIFPLKLKLSDITLDSFMTVLLLIAAQSDFSWT